MRTRVYLGILILLAFVALLSLPAHAQMTIITATSIQDGAESLLANGTMCWLGVDATGKAASYRPSTGGQVTSDPVCRDVVNGAVQTTYKGVTKGPLQVADAFTSVPNVCYRVTVMNSATGRVVIGGFGGQKSPYDCIQPTGTTFDFDLFSPSASYVPPPLAGGSVTGPLNVSGAFSATGPVSVPPPTTGTDAATKAYADTKAPINNPTFTGAVGVPDPTASTQAASRKYVDCSSSIVNAKLCFGAVGDGTTDDTTALIAAANSVATNGGAVYLPRSSGCYKLTSAVPILSKVKWFSDKSDFNGGGACITTSGAIWAFQSANTAIGVKSSAFDDITINLSGNSAALGGWDLSGVGNSRLINPVVYMPTANGSTTIAFKFSDPSVVWGYENNLIEPQVYCTNATNNNQVAFWATNNGNDERITGGISQGCARPVVVDTSNNIAFNGTTFQNGQVFNATLGSSAQGVQFTGANRNENTIDHPTSLVRSSNVVTATFSSHSLNCNLDWSLGHVTVSGATGGTTSFNGTFTPTACTATTITWAQTGASESATTTGNFLHGDMWLMNSTANRNTVMFPYFSSIANPGVDQAGTASTNNLLYSWTSGAVIQVPGTSGGVASFCIGIGGCTPTSGFQYHLPSQSTDVTFSGAGNTRGLNLCNSAGAGGTSNGACYSLKSWEELITLSTSGTTTDSTNFLLAANSYIHRVDCRVVTTITGATQWSAGDATTSARFISLTGALTSGTAINGMNHIDQTGAAGPKQTSASKLRITTTGTPTAGQVRCTVWYETSTPPTS